MKIGIVSLWWPPHYGGGEVYAYRLARALREAAIPVEVITTTPALPARDNGDIDALRCGVFHEPLVMSAFRRFLQGEEHASWCERVARWAGERRFTHILCNAPLLKPGFATATPALIAKLRGTGAVVGAIHHDLGPRTVSSILSRYAECHDWERTATLVCDEQRAKVLARGSKAFYEASGSPLYYDPAFVLSGSHWSARFIDPIAQVPKFVLHPRLPEPRDPRTSTAPEFGRVTVAMINPLAQKGAPIMAQVILSRQHAWTFRVLRGAWGQAFAEFEPMIADALQARDARVDMVGYARDMTAFYRASDVFMFPSRIEGYGLAPVEAMLAGTPAVATDYPAILEAVGDGARIVPYAAQGEEWSAAIADVLAHREDWRARAAARTRALQAREAQELPAFVEFLRSLQSSAAGASHSHA